MDDRCISKAELKKKSEEARIPFSGFLAGYVQEMLVFLIADSDFSEELWLKNPDIEKGDFYSRQYFSIEYIYHLEEKIIRSGKLTAGQNLTKELAELMFANIFVKEKTRGIRWKWNYQLKDGNLSADITAEYEEMKIPIHLEIYSMDLQGIYPEKKTVPFLTDSKREISYRSYPMESILAEQLFSVISYVELIPSMAAYDTIYSIISTEPVNGLHIREMLADLCKQEGLSCEESRGRILAGYADYTYMKNRWEKYRKNLKKEHKNHSTNAPDWKTLMEKLTAFFIPIWNSLSRDEVFFGDWMPELGRYLD